MIAVDTNIIVRLLTGDDAEQRARCQKLIAAERVFVSMTVVLETEWVLRSIYRHTPAQIADAFTNLLGLPNITVESPDFLASALRYVEAGLDFADALHLANAADCDGFVTFDQRLVQTAAALGIANVREP
jgi:predicted nucleic-acid-binding protein